MNVHDAQSLTVGRLARASGVNLDTIRFYERQELLPAPPRTASGYRTFPPETVKRVRFIKRAQTLGFTLKEIGELFALRVAPETTTTLLQEVDRLRREHRDLQIRLTRGSERVEVPRQLESLAQSVLAEAVRNAHKHARPSRVEVTLELSDGDLDEIAAAIERTGAGTGPARPEASHGGQ